MNKLVPCVTIVMAPLVRATCRGTVPVAIARTSRAMTGWAMTGWAMTGWDGALGRSGHVGASTYRRNAGITASATQRN